MPVASHLREARFAAPDDYEHNYVKTGGTIHVAQSPQSSPLHRSDSSGSNYKHDSEPLHADGYAPAQAFPPTAPNSQDSTMTQSQGRNEIRASLTPNGKIEAKRLVEHGGPVGGRGEKLDNTADSGGQLHHLSAIAAAQDRMAMEEPMNAKKRTADGHVKPTQGAASPSRGHSRNTSTMSTISTTSTIGELSADLKTRLSYAMVKVHNGWQNHTIEEVESFASQAASPTSSTSTTHRRKGSSSSPRLITSQVSHPPSANTHSHPARLSNSPPYGAKRPTLAPPATIQPSVSAAPNQNSRRNSNPRYTPTMLSHSQSASPRTPAQLSHPPRINTSLQHARGLSNPMMCSPHQNVREQDAIETLLFMSSPGNSANLKHGISPIPSPGPATTIPRGASRRHALPSEPRKTLPGQRPPQPAKKVGFNTPSMMSHPASPMDLDSPQQTSYRSPNRNGVRKAVNGALQRPRVALSMPVGLGASTMAPPSALRDEDIEKMLDVVATDAGGSSDDEDIQIPRKNGVSNAMRV